MMARALFGLLKVRAALENLIDTTQKFHDNMNAMGIHTKAELPSGKLDEIVSTVETFRFVLHKNPMPSHPDYPWWWQLRRSDGVGNEARIVEEGVYESITHAGASALRWVNIEIEDKGQVKLKSARETLIDQLYYKKARSLLMAEDNKWEVEMHAVCLDPPHYIYLNNNNLTGKPPYVDVGITYSHIGPGAGMTVEMIQRDQQPKSNEFQILDPAHGIVLFHAKQKGLTMKIHYRHHYIHKVASGAPPA